MNNDDFKLLRGFANKRTDIGDCRVAFATENYRLTFEYIKLIIFWKAKHSESVISISSPSVVKGISLFEEKNIFLNTGLTAASINLCARTKYLNVSKLM